MTTLPEFHLLIDQYKRNYIYNEARVERNVTMEEQLGLGEIYDYICTFDFSKDYFNLFVTSLLLHQKLYSKCAYPEFGGKLRDDTAYLLNTSIEVMDANEAKKYFNSLIPVSDQIFLPLNQGDIFGYIENIVKQTVELIKVQPFADGNKRTFRALLNLLLKRIQIPPVYIEVREREKYKEALLEAMKENDFSKIITFYHYKICDAIMNLDIKHSVFTDEQEKQKSQVLKK